MGKIERKEKTNKSANTTEEREEMGMIPSYSQIFMPGKGFLSNSFSNEEFENTSRDLSE